MQGLGSTRSPLEAGALVTLVTLGIAGILGVVAVLDENHEAAAFGTGLGIAVVVFLSGATIVCGLACLARGRIAVIALTSTAVAGIALDLVVLAIWRDIGNDTYAKVAGIAAAWTFFALVALGLTLAVDARGRLSRPLYLGAALSTLIAALISTYLIATAGGDSSNEFTEGGGAAFGYPVDPGDDTLLRVLGAMLVLLASFWFATIAAHRLEQRPESVA
jgi:hypothetical protein